HQSAHDCFGLGDLANATALAQSDLLFKDLGEQRAEVLAAFRPAGRIARLTWFEAAMQRRLFIAHLINAAATSRGSVVLAVQHWAGPRDKRDGCMSPPSST